MFSFKIKPQKIIFHLMFFLMLSGAPLLGNADTLTLSKTPLFLGSSVSPNIFFAVDDSGSMDWEILTPVHWHACSYDPNITGNYSSQQCGFEITNGLLRVWAQNRWRYLIYLYRNGDNDYPDDCSNTYYSSAQVCNAQASDWRVFSASLNRTYYNPDATHSPWQGPCLSDGTSCSNENFFSSRGNPRQGTQGYSQTKNLSGFAYHVWIDDKGYSGNRPLRGAQLNVTQSSNQEVDLWDSFLRIVINSNNAEVYRIQHTPNASGMNRTEQLEATLGSSACYNILGGREDVLSAFEGAASYDQTGGENCRTLAEAQQNIANWYSFERRRSFVAKSAISSVIQDSPHYRYGLSVINQHYNLFTEVPSAISGDFSAHNNALLADLYDFNWPAAGTPLRRGLERAGQYYQNALYGKENPIAQACQQNFSILLTDGFWNGGNPSGAVGDSDRDGINRTLADVAHHYYTQDLSPLDNIVAPNTFDEATHQHMVTFTVAFGVEGTLIDTDNDGWPNPALDESDDWGNPYYYEAAKINDLWHAAFNARGTYVAAQTPQSVSETLAAALANISNRLSSATTVAQNSTTLQTDSQVYQARFDSTNWHGELLAFSIDAEGQVASTPLWNASCMLDGGNCSSPAGENEGLSANERIIITKDWAFGSVGAIPFRFPSNFTHLKNEAGALPPRLIALLANSPHALSSTAPGAISEIQSYGEALVNYLRGERQQEAQNGGAYAFRNRGSALGDIVHSDPIYVASPQRLYNDSFESAPYSEFKAQYADRMPIVYSAANDGMLHAFSAQTGQEVFAYVPGIRENYEKLPLLSQTPYLHEYLADGSPTVSDVVLENTWKTVLVSGMRSGAQGIYALNITDPSVFSEAAADDIFLFEFTDEQDADLGFTHSQVSIVKVPTGSGGSRWAAIFGNGYNNTEPDGYASTSGQGALFIVMLDGFQDGVWTAGEDYIKLPVPTGSLNSPNGLATPYPVDIDGDYITDYVYAGDLAGNLWRFSLSGASSEWSVHQLFEARHSAALDQPITAAPIVGAHPLGLTNGVMVYFGTGKYLEVSDNSSIDQSTQSFYAIWDDFSENTVSRNALLEQKIVAEQSQWFDGTLVNARRTTENLIDWNMHRGWFMNLVVDGDNNNGERQITRPLLRNNVIIFTTLIPSGGSCAFGGDSWIMELDYASGAALPRSPFDFNDNNAFDEGDKITFNYGQGSEVAVASGYQSDVGITATPAVFVAANKLSEVKVISGSAGLGSFAEGPVNISTGRQSWRQLK